MTPNPELCPAGVRASLERYRDHGVPTGGFLEAVLSDELTNAVLRADGHNLELLPHIVAWVSENMAWKIRNSRDAYWKHIAVKAAQRRVNADLNRVLEAIKP